MNRDTTRLSSTFLVVEKRSCITARALGINSIARRGAATNRQKCKAQREGREIQIRLLSPKHLDPHS
eukprot:2852011-Pleurochrysis_carterae.AAC.1